MNNLQLNLAGSYNYTRIEDPTLAVGPCFNWSFLPGGPACTEQNPLNANGFALVNGNALPQAPRWTGDFSLRYGSRWDRRASCICSVICPIAAR